MWGRTPSWRPRVWVRCHRHAATCEGETQRRHCPDGAGPQSQEVRRPPCAKHGGGCRLGWAKGWRWRASDFKHLLAPTTASAGRRTAAPMIGWREVGRCSPYGRGVGAARSRWRCIQHSARVSGKQGTGCTQRMKSEVETQPSGNWPMEPETFMEPGGIIHRPPSIKQGHSLPSLHPRTLADSQLPNPHDGHRHCTGRRTVHMST